MPIETPNYNYQPDLFSDADLFEGDESLNPGNGDGGLGSGTSPDATRATKIMSNPDATRETTIRGALTLQEQRQQSELARVALGNLPAVPEWYEEYLKLTQKGWPWRVAAYIAWASMPKRQRIPKTQIEFATDVLRLGTDRQIIKWKVRPAVMDMISRLQVAPMLQHRADVFEALIRSATDPDYKSHADRKLYLEITGDYIPSSKLDAILNHSAGSGVDGKSTDDLLRDAGYADE